MKDILIDALMKVSYVKSNRDENKRKFIELMNSCKTIEEKASHFYSFFTSKKASKADFAQQLAYDLERKYMGKADELKDKIPQYLVKAIKYVTKR